MNQRSFNKAVSIVTLVFFLATPLSTFAQTDYGEFGDAGNREDVPGSGFMDYTLGNSGSDALLKTKAPTGLIQDTTGVPTGCGPNGCGANAGSGLNAAGGFLNMFGGGGAGGNNQLLSGLAIGSLMGGGGGGGATGAVSQALTLAGALTGNMGLMLAGMITSMLGGLAGGAGATPQRGNVDEQYVAPGQAGPYGAGYGSGGYNPYYSPVPTATPIPVASCEKTIFIVKDTTVTPNTVKPYPTAVEIPQNQCVLAINSDTSASHSVQVKDQDTVKATQSIDKEKSHIFRFENKKTYTLCVDAVATSTSSGQAAACTTVTVK
ncbi:MAG: hypothetical protein A3C02_01135 [Candidatus Andersenbacteria bacterium RIFCSPHIGHO2_02_FULL_45_11]|uniref:Uncharacterized protein n=1 Tax=Candidatus Andersenbacteria bacterium RIFCSPHIGHO2_12_FULL_45_11 TaxID=1797281 RepID=A0A1G1X1G5_9BACT|nr:MAG: hypothetical protein A2805_04135 [Candidatus Andersenbacteria bacterium RIFCSPHIGHO2_01_FULL_46_36]OGY33586.1 MAG: hypothetical protein A3C02_01135 [Candidatus Andersenbacteria bacterium RIFCSPHIGHO2_02_FULL_45_11]OGY33852.1 MAG: hypothetical protein A3D99_03905 [Candidatus Andersenbacteria bacterium RIFCSPHIGHO2_12_FULL_45_11]